MVQYFTKDGLQKLKDELSQLKTVENKRIVRLIAEAAAFGDLKENAAYHDARDKMSFLRMRIAELEGAINEAVIRDKDDGNHKIQIGSEIKILFCGVEEKYQVVAPAEANILKNKISYQSPLGGMLMGRSPGEEFKFQPGNPSAGSGQVKEVKIKILEIK